MSYSLQDILRRDNSPARTLTTYYMLDDLTSELVNKIGKSHQFLFETDSEGMGSGRRGRESYASSSTSTRRNLCS